MSLNESIVEDIALGWFGELGYAVGHGPHLAPGEPAAERDGFGEMVLVGRLRAAIRRLYSITQCPTPWPCAVRCCRSCREEFEREGRFTSIAASP
jgi:hypothetical protein